MRTPTLLLFLSLLLSAVAFPLTQHSSLTSKEVSHTVSELKSIGKNSVQLALAIRGNDGTKTIFLENDVASTLTQVEEELSECAPEYSADDMVKIVKAFNVSAGFMLDAMKALLEQAWKIRTDHPMVVPMVHAAMADLQFVVGKAMDDIRSGPNLSPAGVVTMDRDRASFKDSFHQLEEAYPAA